MLQINGFGNHRQRNCRRYSMDTVFSYNKGITHNFDLNISDRTYRIRSAAVFEPTIKTVKFNAAISNISSTFKNHGSYKRLSFATTGNPSQTGSIILKTKKDRELTITVAVGTGRVTIKP